MKINFKNKIIAVIGLGYVGLPLSVEFGKKRKVIGYDINPKRISDLKNGIDNTLEVSYEDLSKVKWLEFTNDPNDIKDASIYIVTVPTPIDKNKNPDLSLLLKASETIGAVLKPGDTVIYESTVYPGATEEDCVPVLEKYSGLDFNRDFFCGYSPERINPGDKDHPVTAICKVTSGSTSEVAEEIDELYASIITAGTYMAPSIKVAEAAKVIENTQRDLNIALVNELAIIFNKMGIDSEAVLKAAGTKWNFIPFRPGLVGGHCIGVDPYYLTHKSKAIGYYPQVILSGRRINDGMGGYVASQMIKGMLKKGMDMNDVRVLILGITFKENCPDIRNTRVVDVMNELIDCGIKVDLHDPRANKEEVYNEYGLTIIEKPTKGIYDGIILAVGHKEFEQMGAKAIKELGKINHIFYDLKYLFEVSESDLRL
ncbi:Vi polysaccharide biosynthesis UDP-N-acetylglucosamine C-6 dehydrogenase TviB [Gammaproteobacteria bacterium]|nr:Vi polysaccharide biosynthesis UDP-N-acetylglucosamine C-6 dehydrogenase TviB [Gammaproteobacteria bacterium]